MTVQNFDIYVRKEGTSLNRFPWGSPGSLGDRYPSSGAGTL